jgi:hypothetical protein
MRTILSVLFFFLFISCATAKEKKYTGSTPAGQEVKIFLGISLSDSAGFIRWVLIINDNSYALDCNYGIVKPNTNGFIDNGKRITLTGFISKNGNYFRLENNNRFLNIVMIDTNLLQLLSNEKKMLVGDGGWSYTLNNTSIAVAGTSNINSQFKPFKDSLVLVGRTPCAIPGALPEGTNCYKLKWHVVMYNDGSNTAGTYTIFGNLWTREQPKTGNWSIVKSNGSMFLKLTDFNKKIPVFLKKIDDNIFMFADSKGSLLVGNEDFSYTLNRKI